MTLDFLFLFWTCGVVVKTAPVIMVDMTYDFDDTTLNYPGMTKFKTKTIVDEAIDDHRLFYEDCSSAVHVGTHMDSMAHFYKNGKTIDQIPISHFFAPAAVIDYTRKAENNPDSEVEVSDLKNWENQTGLSLDNHIVLMKSGWGKYWGNRTAYFGTSTNDRNLAHFPGISPGAAQWLVDNRIVHGIGVETFSPDKGQGAKSGNPTHQVLLGAEVFILECVANMDKIPISGAQLTVMPMKIRGGSGAPTRIVATFPVSVEYLSS